MLPKLLCFAVVLGALLPNMVSGAQIFGIRVGSAMPSPLVGHANLWRYHLGSNYPGAGWQTVGDVTLDSALWGNGPGGFGYSTDTPAETNDCGTILQGLFNGPTTLYIRKSFVVGTSPDPAAHLLLTMDWDDGFVAYLDGVEIQRAVAPGAAGVEPTNNAVATASHESFRGTGGASPVTYDLGPVGSRLDAGTHTLAILGLNRAADSTDFILVPELALGPSSGLVVGPLLAVVNSLVVPITVTNTLTGSTRVTINGSDAEFDPDSGTWLRSQALTPGCNLLNIEAMNSAGAVLFSTNQVIVSRMTVTNLATLGTHTVLDSSMGIVQVTNNLSVPNNGSLTIGPGTVILLEPGNNIRATAGASIIANGTAENPICLFTANGTSMWGEIAAEGTNSILTLRHVETIGGAIKGRSGATGLLEDSYFHDYKNGTVPIAGCTGSRSMTVRRCHFRVYHETLWQTTLMTIEDCLFEHANNPSSDALDFDGAPPGSVIRRTTFRHGPQSNTDAIDIGPLGTVGCTNTLIEKCLMFDFPNDKGISIGEGSYGIVVSNCLIYGNNHGIQVKDSPGGRPPCTANIFNTTIVNCSGYGFHCFDKSDPASGTEGGRITNSFNNILWNNALGGIGVFNDGLAVADHSDIGGGWLGLGNFDANPLFINAAENDFRLATNSPCIGAGRDSATLGPRFPLGAPMAPSHPYFSSVTVRDGLIKLGFWVDSEKNYTVQRSDQIDGAIWTKVADVYHQLRPRYIEVTNNLASGNFYYRLVTPVQP